MLSVGGLWRCPAIGKALGTSRTPVREALMRLHEEGLIDFVPRRGPIVRTLMLQEMHEILLVREALEGLASRIAARRIPVARVKELRAEWEELRATLPEATLDQLHEKGYAFHATIINAAGNQTLARMLDSIRGRLASSRQLYLETLGPLALKRAPVARGAPPHHRIARGRRRRRERGIDAGTPAAASRRDPGRAA